VKANKYAWEKFVRDSEALTSKDKLVAFIMGTYANKDGWNVMVSQKTMARQVAASLSTIERAVRKLIAADFIEQTHRAVNRGPRPGPARYRLTIPLCYWGPVPEGVDVNALAFYPSVENEVHPSPMAADTPVDVLVHPSSAMDESEWWEAPPVISDGWPLHSEAIDPSLEVDSPFTDDGLTVFNRFSTEEEDHFGTNVPSPTPIPARTRTASIQPPLVTAAPEPLGLGPSQPRLFLEARLGRGLTDEEDVLAAKLDWAGKTRTQILSALYRLQMA
jgi:hypothetical protein